MIGSWDASDHLLRTDSRCVGGMTESACHDGRMADRQDSDREVLTSLPRSRPVRRSAKRGARPAPVDAATMTAASPRPAAAKKPAAATSRRKTGAAKTGAAAGSAKPRTKVASTAAPTATTSGASAPRPRPATKRPRPQAAPRRDPQATPRRDPQAPPRRDPQAVPRRERQRAHVSPARKVPPAGYAAPVGRGEHERGSGTAELLSTAIQAANELTQIGLTVGRQALQSMLDRLPKP